MPLKLFRSDPRSRTRWGAAASGQGTRPQLGLILLTSLWIATVGNLALWRELWRLPELANPRGLVFALSFALVIAAATSAVLSLLAWRWTLKPAITLCLVAAAAGAYFMLSYGVVIDSTMMLNALQSDSRELLDLLNWRMLAALALIALLPMVWVWSRPRVAPPFLQQLLANTVLLVASLALIAGVVVWQYPDGSSVMRNHTDVRYLINPLNSLYAVGEVAAQPFRRKTMATLPIGQDARLDADATAADKPALLLLVIGETARSDHLALNGYARPTTPELALEKVTSFRNAWSCGTTTAASVPCLFSHMRREAYEGRDANYENLLDLLQRAGLAVLWVDNQSGCKGVCERIPHVNTLRGSDPQLCPNGECFDEIMLQGLEGRIAELPADRRARGVVVVLHQLGSHGPAYSRRSPPAFKAFMPECTSNALQECAREQLINAFDNSIVYTDHFLASAIHWLRAREDSHSTALMYVSDHGESLGENNLYLHGLPYTLAPDAQKHVPWITWLSPAFEQRGRISPQCLHQRRDTRLTHDHYFHSVLGLLRIETALYDPALDLFKPCVRRG